MKRIIYILLLCLAVLSAKAGQDTPVRLGIIGLTHSHVGGVLNDKNKPYVIAGIVEPDKQLAERMSKRFGFSMEIVYSTMQELYDQQHPEAVALLQRNLLSSGCRPVLRPQKGSHHGRETVGYE